ncbi:MAG TPA: aminopeptidase N [Acidiferrobacterales bacterium]
MADLTDSAPKAIHLTDYRPPDYLIETVALRFDLDAARTRVHARLTVAANPAAGGGVRPLRLNGDGPTLLSVAIDGRKLDTGEYRLDAEFLTLPDPPARCVLDIETEIHPQDNTALEGLYVSSGNFCTQCEAEGFRRMTFFPDRPDVMARYTTTLVADKASYPVLLSNGNLVHAEDLPDGRHLATWEDPFPKPSYLFALVAGDLARIEDEFVTRSGRKVALHMFVQHHNTDKCAHAMAALKKAMAWDERVYGREYDLDVYMIVAVDDFNMGAMENKGLNVFNSKYVLARPDTATDADYVAIEGVIGHEYFHNWSGNRVTCRDWFQLSLKEGFTVFRDQEFSADMGSRGVKRIQDVNVLRSHQFREDAGPMAHPVRPESYVEINNFYTLTVYNKGAELVRMLHHLLGPAGFRKGTDLYFDRHDGQAVTTDDFVRALEHANGADLAQFRRWYSQAGTPVLTVTRDYDAQARRYALTVRQSCPPTPQQPHKEPFHIPLAVGLLDPEGVDLPLKLEGEARAVTGTRVLAVRAAEERFVFEDVPRPPVPSLLRGFSAPVRLEIDLSDDERGFLMAHDSDPFNRWEAGQQLAVKLILARIAGAATAVPAAFVDAFRKTLASESLDAEMKSQVLSLPGEGYVGEFMAAIDPVAVHDARQWLKRELARALRDDWLAVHASHHDAGPYRVDPPSIGRRALKNLSLAYLMELGQPETVMRCVAQYQAAANMTDALAALGCLAHSDAPQRERALADFHDRWHGDPLVMDKWLAIQAGSRRPDTLERVRRLTAHPVFNIRNPNKVRALIGAFAQGNPARFHEPGGAGYAFLTEYVLKLDPMNPQVAARLVNGLSQWRRYVAPQRDLMRAQLERLRAQPKLSRDVFEIVDKSLADMP